MQNELVLTIVLIKLQNIYSMLIIMIHTCHRMLVVVIIKKGGKMNECENQERGEREERV